MVQTRMVDSPRRRALDSSPKGAALAGLMQLLLIGAVAVLAILTKDAAPVSLEAPRAEVLSARTSGDVRQLKLRITSPRAAPIISVYFDDASGATRPSVNGRPWTTMATALGTGGKRWALRYYALPPEGIELALDAKAGQPLVMRLVDQSYGLPASLTERTRPRPDGLIPVSLPYNDSTMVAKVYTF